ncbi:MAG: hypothetical protein J7K33_09540 [Candidatus Marinimicrobia bacterium]|nr:hypothetical protein [Candidatus Neomarinimicrobiota bacterium]
MEIMESITLTQSEIAKIITDQELFFGISHKEAKYEEVFKFLATYIFLSQVLFLRLYSVEHPMITEGVSLGDIDKERQDCYSRGFLTQTTGLSSSLMFSM